MLLAAADRAFRLTQAVYDLAATVEADAKSRDWVDGELLALFRDGVSVWSTLFAYGLLRTRHDMLRGVDDAAQAEWAMASGKLAEQIAGQDAAGVGDAGRLTPTVARILGQYDVAAAATAANARRDGEDEASTWAPIHELASHGFGGPASADELAVRFAPLIAALVPAADAHVRQIYDMG